MLFIFELLGIWLLFSLLIFLSPSIINYIKRLHHQLIQTQNTNIEKEILTLQTEIEHNAVKKQQLFLEIENLHYQIKKLLHDHNAAKQKIQSISTINIQEQKKTILLNLLTQKVDHLFDKVYKDLKNNEQITNHLNNQKLL